MKFDIMMVLASFSIAASGAELPVTMMPAPVPSTAIQIKKETPKQIIVRDSAIGLGAGAIAGLAMAAMAPGGNKQAQGDALATGAVVGLISGLVTGLWETKRREVNAASSSENY